MCSFREVQKKRSCTSSGFTLLELLVAITIIGVVLGLLLPAVQKVREASLRLTCDNNLRQIGIGLLQHHDVYAILPSSGGWDGEQQIEDVNGNLFYVSSGTFIWGVGDPKRSPQDQTGSWAYAILPYIEQQAMYQQQTRPNPGWTYAVKLYICPSRRIAIPQLALNPDPDANGPFIGGGWVWGKTDYAANPKILPLRPSQGQAACFSISAITDGTSNTILIGEKAMEPKNYNTGTWYYDEPFYTGGSEGVTRFGFEVLKDAPGVEFESNWGSAHTATVEFLFADGSVHGLKDGMDWPIVYLLMTPDGGESVPDY